MNLIALRAFLARIPLKDWLYAAAFVSLIWTGWYLRGVYDDHVKLAEIEAMQRAEKALQEGINKQATKYEADRVKAATELQTTKQQLRALRAKHNATALCSVQSDWVPVLNQ